LLSVAPLVMTTDSAFAFNNEAITWIDCSIASAAILPAS
jgi:hypothetical protein